MGEVLNTFCDACKYCIHLLRNKVFCLLFVLLSFVSLLHERVMFPSIHYNTNVVPNDVATFNPKLFSKIWLVCVLRLFITLMMTFTHILSNVTAVSNNVSTSPSFIYTNCFVTMCIRLMNSSCNANDPNSLRSSD